MNKLFISEKISFKDFLIKYTIRDIFLGILNIIPSSIGVALRMFFYRFFLKHCGKKLLLKNFITIKFPERISIGNYVGIGEYSLLEGIGQIEIGNFVRIGSHVSLISFNHNYKNREVPIKLQGKTLKKITIEDDCWIGAGVIILAGVKVKRGSIIGAGSVVTKDVPPYSVMAGVPAKIIQTR